MAAKRDLVCPVCTKGVMRKMILSAGAVDVLVDYCGMCGGLWLDRGELAAIVASEIRLHDINRGGQVHGEFNSGA